MDRFVSSKAKIGRGTTLGYFVVVEDDVEIGENCIIGHNVVIHRGSTLGNNCLVGDGSIIGKLPMKAARSATTKEQILPPAVLGNDCMLGANCIIYAGTIIGERVLIADLATVRENVTIGDYTIVGRGVAIENECTIGKKTKLETNVYITAYSDVGDYVFVAPGVNTSNDNFIGRTEERFKQFRGVTIKKAARIGVQATILPGKTIGEDALVAGGALVTKDIPPRKIYAGIPARYFRDVPEEQLLENQTFYEGD